jgi:putative RNA 2'-phosphotransferase
MMNKKDKTRKISKFLSFILRHNPQSIKLKLDAQGWADIGELIEKSKEIKLTRALIEEVVRENDKQRFIIDGNRIRANQGHSINIDLALKAVKPPKVLYHGTATRFLDSIMKEGLSKQSRQHVHLSKDIETATIVGKRHGKVVILEVNAQKMFEEGYEFYLSENGVWLTDSVAVEYLNVR